MLALLAVTPRERWIWWEWVGGHTDEIWAAAQEHVELTVIAVVLGSLISLPLSVLIARRPRWAGPVLGVTGALYTIPSLALFALLIPWTGLTRTTAEIGLVSYTLLILVRNIVTGLLAVPAEVRDAAQGMGFSARQQLWRVELPLAVPSIIAGVRIATVTTIGLVTVTALIGQGGLGSLILDGLRREFRTPLVLGTALSVALAVLADVSLLGLQRVLTPWSRRSAEAVPEGAR